MEEIIDRERYQALLRRENYDAKIQRYSHIPEIQLYNEIKEFYRMFQTQETEERLDKLEQAALLMEEKIRGRYRDGRGRFGERGHVRGALRHRS